MALENVLSVAHALADRLLQLLELLAALPASFQMGANFSGGAGRRLAIGIAEQLFVFEVNYARLAHSSLFFKRAMARLRNSPTADGLMPRADPISG